MIRLWVDRVSIAREGGPEKRTAAGRQPVASSVPDWMPGELAIATGRDPLEAHERRPHHVHAAHAGFRGDGHTLRHSVDW